MEQVTTVGLDVAKKVFQVHGVDAAGVVLIRRSLRRSRMLAFFAKLPPCMVGMEVVCDIAPLGAKLPSWAMTCG